MPSLVQLSMEKAMD
uniref:Uncharacterized protein n=1 Tax=Anguilla anguilla TaxID=7936 RepID=A0A0E9RR31_ANGAN